MFFLCSIFFHPGSTFDDGTIYKFVPSPQLRENIPSFWQKQSLAEQNLLDVQYRSDLDNGPPDTGKK